MDQSEGFEFEIYSLNVSFELCCECADSRYKDRSDQAYEMTPLMMEMFWQQFEPSSKGELAIRVNS
ncbi:hypothetical protein [Agarivorans sp. Alg241-V36]|uniref:hypothetical protein n=1 Tax=Agarivorans sp. Alg241-V36 TaxID=2305992 RepID=UPI0013D34D0F|nr:hypothetical protein [Agarivorans sp. Alg241-V36]